MKLQLCIRSFIFISHLIVEINSFSELGWTLTMSATTERRPELKLYRTSKKLFLPIIWMILVVWFLRRAFHRRDLSLDKSPSNSDQRNSSTSAFHEATHIVKPYGTLPNAIHTPANISTSNKVAVIVDTRSSGNIVPLVLHFSAVLGPEWPVLIYTPAENFGTFSTSSALLRYQRIGRVVIRPLADGVYFPNRDSVSEFLTKSWLWEELAPAEHVLLFQSDSILCSNSVRSVEDFFEYDFVGAPIVAMYGQGFKGGLSLRKRSTIMKILTDWTYMAGDVPEDQWYYTRSVFAANAI